MNHKTTFVLLLILVFGLWTNFLAYWVPASVAQENKGYTLQSVYARLIAVQNDLAEVKREVDQMNNSLTEIKTGTCRNPRIC